MEDLIQMMRSERRTGDGFIRVHYGSEEKIQRRDYLFKPSSTHSDSWLIEEGYGIVNDKEYSCFIKRDGFGCYYVVQNEDDIKSGRYLNSTRSSQGNKIHISLADFNNIVHAWNRIIPLLCEYGVSEFKVRTEHPPAGASFQPGKNIVIYLSNSRPELPWLELLSKIESQLCSAPTLIAPGPNPTYRIDKIFFNGSSGHGYIAEPRIPGSRFLYVERDDIVLESPITYRPRNDKHAHPIQLGDLCTNLGPCIGFDLSPEARAVRDLDSSTLFADLLRLADLPNAVPPSTPGSFFDKNDHLH